MSTCYQTPGQHVLDHGRSVHHHLLDLLGPRQLPWRLPDWLPRWWHPITHHLHPPDTLRLYTTYHDCGKPYCSQPDQHGRPHFPNHAQISQQVWDQGIGGDPTVGRLIGLDMLLHTATAHQLQQTELTPQDAATLLVVSLAELHSNAQLFGGITTTNFKIKHKQLTRRGHQLCQQLWPDPDRIKTTNQ